MINENRRVVVIGGGTGTYTVLTGLKKYPINLTDIVTMMDSGGSSGRLRDEFGHLPPGDLRQGLVALSSSPVLRELFNYRFNKGNGLEGHSFGNLFLTALTELTGSSKQAIKEAQKLLAIKGEVLPVTYSKAQLGAVLNDGREIIGEDKFDAIKEQDSLDIKKIFLDSKVRSNPVAIQAINKADLVIIGPGDLYRSILPNFLVKGISETVKKTRAKVVYIVNLMTSYGKPAGLSAKEHVQKVEEFVGKERVDFIIINNGLFPQEILERYKKEKDLIVKDDLDNQAKIIRSDILARGQIKKVKGDLMKRSYIRHDSDKLALVLYSLLGNS